MQVRFTSVVVAVSAIGLSMLATPRIAAGDPPEPRSIDGRGNNVEHPRWGSTKVRLRRIAGVAYVDGMSIPARDHMPSTRFISNRLCAQAGDMPNARRASDMFWQWGQFLDHDLDLTEAMSPAEPMPIEVPKGDPVMDPAGTGTQVIPFLRSIYAPQTGTDPGNPRQQLNQITAFIDASQVYGSDAERATALRQRDGTGRLAMSPGDLLPFNHVGLHNHGGAGPHLFLAGDVRANEQVGLTSLHTLFVREHNRQALNIAAAHPGLDDETIYQRARARVGAIMQVITYEEFLPILLGPGALEPYAGYDPEVHPGISNVFSTVAYRVGHTMLSPVIRRIDADGRPIDAGHLSLVEAFFAPGRIVDEGGIEPILRGLAASQAQEVDVRVVDEVRNLLFFGPEPIGLDLAALNMQRGRDHGIPAYNDLRAAMGLTPVSSIAQITSDPDLATAIGGVYGSVDEIDPWIGALAEDHVPGAMVGELVHAILCDQFRRLRDGDRFWYQRVFGGQALERLERERLAAVIRRNTTIGEELHDRVMLMPACQGDLDGDGVVDVADLVIVLQAWGTTDETADLDGDGIVDLDDLFTVILGWGAC